MKRWRTEAVNVKDKVVVITGGGGGIGLAAARGFAHGQAHVLITGRRGQALEEIRAAFRSLR
jgi:NAD(P)-dependent dehydrogenase (short-subunit alcohol dehydrogenase family)